MKFIRFIFWLLALLILVVVGDRVLMQHSFDAPGVKPAQQFYRDFRERLLTLHRSTRSGDEIGQTIDQEVLRQEPVKSSRYLYVDSNGTLHFADSLQQVPAAYRRDAQVLED